MPFGNPIVAGDFVEGSTAAYDVVSAASSLLYRGEELADVIGRGSRGLIAWGQINPPFNVGAGAATRPLIELDFETEIHRAYRIYTNPVRMTSPVGTENPRFLLFSTSDGTQPVPFAGTTFLGEIAGSTNVVGGRVQATQISWTAYPETTRYRVLLASDAEFGNAYSMPYDPIKLHVEDCGYLQLSNTGINRYAGAGAPKLHYAWEFTTSHIFSYKGSGAYADNAYMYQGQSPFAPNGNQRSWCYYAGNYTEITHLAGVPDSDIIDLAIYLDFPHWAYPEGGDAIIGYHTLGTPPAIGANEPGGAVYAQGYANFAGRGVQRWLNIRNSGISNALFAGTFRGFTLGPGIDTNYRYYGYATPNVRIKAEYFK